MKTHELKYIDMTRGGKRDTYVVVTHHSLYIKQFNENSPAKVYRHDKRIERKEISGGYSQPIVHQTIR